MNRLFIGLFAALTVLAGIATFAAYPTSQGDSLDNLSHVAVSRRVTNAAATVKLERMARSTSIRNGSTHYSGGGYSSGSYRGGK